MVLNSGFVIGKRILFNNLVFAFIIISVILFSLSDAKAYTIKCHITGYADSTKFYLVRAESGEYVDSASIVKDNFSFECDRKIEPEKYIITTKQYGMHYLSFYLGNDNVTIEGKKEEFPSLKIKGAKTEDENREFEEIRSALVNKRIKLVGQFYQLPNKEDNPVGKAIWDTIAEIDKKYNQILCDFINNHTGSYISVINLDYMSSFFSKDSVKFLFEKLSPEVRNSSFAKRLRIFLYEKLYDKGDNFMDFEAYNQDNKLVKFSSYKFNYILLDFTRSDCSPCRASIKELKRINDEYKDRLKIISFFVDGKKEDWLNAIKLDSITWETLWDGKSNKSETCMRYNVNGVPEFVLVGPEGIIVDKWTGYGREGQIENHLKQFLSE